MRLLWAVAIGIVGGIIAAWLIGRHAPGEEEARQAREQRARAAADAAWEESRPVLYRWRDANGVRQVTDQPPPPGVEYEKVDIQPRDGIQIDGTKR